jgi:hypothetical protein
MALGTPLIVLCARTPPAAITAIAMSAAAMPPWSDLRGSHHRNRFTLRPD